MRRFLTILLAVILSGAGPAMAQKAESAGSGEDVAPPVEEHRTFNGAVLQGLDKVTARISEFEAPAGVTVPFGSLRITVRDCHKRPPEETPESTAFVEIDDLGTDDRAKRYFSGWMFASSPALSAMEHPVYDVWVVDCMKSVSASSESSETKLPETSNADDNN